jgi:HSP20 family protein
MPNKGKGKNGNGARTESQTTERRNLPAPRTEPSRPPARAVGHPLTRLRDEIDSLFDRFLGSWPAPAEWGWNAGRFWDADVEDTGEEILVRAEAPGFEPKDFDIHISGNLLTIQAEHKQEAEEKKEGYRSWERRYGRFQRSIPLPAAVDADKVEAHYRNGVLELRLPRTEEAQRRRIEVKA